MERDRLVALLDRLNPGPGPILIQPPLTEAESLWFLRAVDGDILAFRTCPIDCPMRSRSHASGPDEFVTNDGGLRHLFSFPPDDTRLNREYIPHIAGYAYAILAAGYSRERSAFSKYRSFQRDAITRRRGSWYETDGEFYNSNGDIWLHLEAKREDRQVDAIAQQLDIRGDIRSLSAGVAKEVEYVLDLHPRYLWLVGPDSIDPPRHIFAVTLDGDTATFDRLNGLPPPPGL